MLSHVLSQVILSQASKVETAYSQNIPSQMKSAETQPVLLSELQRKPSGSWMSPKSQEPLVPHAVSFPPKARTVMEASFKHPAAPVEQHAKTLEEDDMTEALWLSQMSTRRGRVTRWKAEFLEYRTLQDSAGPARSKDTSTQLYM